MRHAIILLLPLLANCAGVDPGQVRDVAGTVGTVAIAIECNKTDAVRQKRLNALNTALEATDSRARFLGIDCDGDGARDF